MKKITLVLICLMMLTALNIFSDVITIAADEWMPYNGVPKSDKPGYGIELAEMIFKEAGHTVKYEVIPWNRAVQTTRNGQYTAVIGAFKEDAPDFIYPDVEFGYSINEFFVKVDSKWQYSGLNSLDNKKIGLIKDYSYGDELDEYFSKNSKNVDFVFGSNPLEMNIKKLVSGRIDVFVEDRNVAAQKIAEINLTEKVKSAGSPSQGNKIYIAFSPKNPKSKEYAEILTKGIKKMEENGELKKLLTKYKLKYWK